MLIPFLSLAAMAQSDTTGAKENRLYIGAGFSTVSYHIYYNEPDEGEKHGAAYFAPLSLNIGYKWNERNSIQVGIAYGGSYDHFSWSAGSNDTLSFEISSRTHVLAVPVNIRHTLFKAFKRFPVYGTATVMPALGFTKTSTIETRHQVATTSTLRDSGINIFLTAGVGVEYKISKRFRGFFEYQAYKHNLTGRNSLFYDWDMGTKGFYKFIRTIGVGVNYHL